MKKLIILLGVVGASLSAIFVRLSDAPSLVLVFYRMLFSVAVLAPWSVLTCRAEWKQTTRREVLLSLLSGLFLGFHFTLYFSSLRHTSIAASVVLVDTEVFFVAFMLLLLFKERIPWPAWIGIIIMALAIYGEATADKQKSAAKKINPKRFCDTGLYRYCRCPNYFSEILFWVGVTITGIGAVQGKQWIMVLIALALITYVMYNSASRLELRHEKTYGLDPEYQKYSDTVPLLFPVTKQYHSMKVYRD